MTPEEVFDAIGAKIPFMENMPNFAGWYRAEIMAMVEAQRQAAKKEERERIAHEVKTIHAEDGLDLIDVDRVLEVIYQCWPIPKKGSK